jgi:hypothetical protein
MSIPKSKVLSVSKGVMTNAKLAYSSPKQSQSVTVNITPNGNAEIKNENDIQEPPLVKYGDNANPYSNLELPGSVEEYKQILEYKDKQMQALNLIIEIIKSNPLIMNKFIIADHNSLLELIRLLTNSDDVEFTEKDIDIGCCSVNNRLFYVDNVFVRKGGEVYNLKYSFTDVIRILEHHNISIKIVKIN